MIGETAPRFPARPSMLQLASERFLRAVAVLCLAFGLFYWARLVGVHEGTVWRFDLMPMHWRVAATALAVLFPFAAVGLWLLAPWGPVIWFVCAASETVMYAGFPDRYGDRMWVVAVHASVALVYLAMRVANYIQRRRSA